MTTDAQGRGRDDHEPFDELAVGWALHALEPEDEAAFGAHLVGCDRCARTVAETHDVMAALAMDLPPAEPSDSLGDRLRAAVEQTEQLPPPHEPTQRAEPPVRQPARPASRHPAFGLRPPPTDGPPPPRALQVPDPRPPWRRVLPHALVAAAVAAILALGSWNAVLSGDRDAVRATATEQSQMIKALLSPGRATIAPLTEDGRTVATVVARSGQVQVVATGLPLNDTRDSTYVVWGVGAGSPVALGTFDVVSPQMDLRTVGSTATGLDEYSTYAISREPGRQAPPTPSEIVANGQVTS
ncbi:MAG: Anti-sigma-K factor rskA [Modestobacter sp.]|nr:Anti-sigma-K factor rskA [Modestobacter sp.]